MTAIGQENKSNDVIYSPLQSIMTGLLTCRAQCSGINAIATRATDHNLSESCHVDMDNITLISDDIEQKLDIITSQLSVVVDAYQSINKSSSLVHQGN